ncbi:hypothetical protein ACVMGC_011513 [Bradyrhizobium barranii subsp. barranii]
MTRFSVEDLRKMKRAVAAAMPRETRLLHKVKHELKLETLARQGRRRRREIEAAARR